MTSTPASVLIAAPTSLPLSQPATPIPSFDPHVQGSGTHRGMLEGNVQVRAPSQGQLPDGRPQSHFISSPVMQSRPRSHLQAVAPPPQPSSDLRSGRRTWSPRNCGSQPAAASRSTSATGLSVHATPGFPSRQTSAPAPVCSAGLNLGAISSSASYSVLPGWAGPRSGDHVMTEVIRGTSGSAASTPARPPVAVLTGGQTASYSNLRTVVAVAPTVAAFPRREVFVDSWEARHRDTSCDSAPRAAPDPEASVLQRQVAERDSQIASLQEQVKQLGLQLAGSGSSNSPVSAPAAQSWGPAIAELADSLEVQRREMQMLQKTMQDQSLEMQDLHAENKQLRTIIEDLQDRVSFLNDIQHSKLDQGLRTASWEPPAKLHDDGGYTAADSDRAASLERNRGSSRSSPRGPHRDLIDQRLEEYLASRPDFAINIDKVKPGWYVFGDPVQKKMFLKIVGDHVVCRVGGGHKELYAYLDDYWLAQQDRVEYDIQHQRVRSRKHYFN